MIISIEEEKKNVSDSDDEGSEDDREEETTGKDYVLEEQEAYDRQKARDALPKDDTTQDYLDPVELRKYITTRN